MTDQINTNAALPQNFAVIFDNLPNITFNCTRVQFPGVSGGSVQSPTPFQPLHLSGTSFEHDPLSLEVILNEDYSSYFSLVKWIKQRTISESFDQYNDQEASNVGIYSNGTIQLYTSANNPSKIVKFEGLFPLSVSGFTLDSQTEQPEPITFSATFEYQKFNFV